MPPGSTTIRFFERFGENVLRHGSHEWLPYSKDEVRLKSSNNSLTFLRFDFSGIHLRNFAKM